RRIHLHALAIAVPLARVFIASPLARVVGARHALLRGGVARLTRLRGRGVYLGLRRRARAHEDGEEKRGGNDETTRHERQAWSAAQGLYCACGAGAACFYPRGHATMRQPGGGAKWHGSRLAAPSAGELVE